MNSNNDYSYKFKLFNSALPEDTFHVIAFKGTQSIGDISRFVMTLASSDPEVDFKEVLYKNALLRMYSDGSSDALYSGIVSHISQKQHFHNHYVYELELSSKLYLLTKTKYYRVFMGKTVQEIIEEILLSSGLNRTEFEFQVHTPAVVTEYVCQFGETNFNFIRRWLERVGGYSYSIYSEEGEKIIFTENRFSHQSDTMQRHIHYNTEAFSDIEELHKTATEVVYNYNRVPKKVIVKDYFYERPMRNPVASVNVDDEGVGEIYTFNPNVYTDERLKYFADIKAQAEACQKETLECKSFIMNIKPGFIYELSGHPRESLNENYLAVSVEHEGVVPFYLSEGFKVDFEHDHAHNYSNKMTLIPANTQFRLMDVTPKPVAPGSISAKVDAETSARYPHIDHQGRYKVIMPFDLNTSHEAKASIWLRMAQPSAGEGQGMHFPLRKGTEVLIDFVGGNPDNPYIAAAVPNPLTLSPVTDKNLTKSIILSETGNALIMEDEAQHESVSVEVPAKETTLNLGHYKDQNGEDAKGLNYTAPSYTGTINGNHYTTIAKNHTLKVDADSTENVQLTKTLTTTNYNVTYATKTETGDSKEDTAKIVQEKHLLSMEAIYTADLSYGSFKFDGSGTDMDIVALLDFDVSGASIEIQGYRLEKTKYCAEDRELSHRLHTLEVDDHVLQKCVVDYYKTKNVAQEFVGQLKKEKYDLEKKFAYMIEQSANMSNVKVNVYKNGPAIIIGES